MVTEPAIGRETLTVLIPCLNEEATVGETVRTVLETAPSLDVDVALHLIDDGSQDRTDERMRELCDAHPNVTMHTNPHRQGVGRCVLDAYERLDPETWVTVVPGDNEIIFQSIANHLAVRREYDVILGYFQNPVIRTLTRRMASQSFSAITRLLYGFSYRYLNGLKLYKAGVFRGLEVVSGGHAFNAELLAKALLRRPELRIGEVPFLARGRSVGKSRAFRPSSIWRAVWEVYRGYLSVQKYRVQVIRGS
jgi:glycosyltransferase involved in cell wall biosynthesis